MALRAAMHQAGATALSQLLRCEPPGVEERQIPCSCGHKARFREMHARHVLTAVGEGEFLRPWHLCSQCHNGQCPADAVLDIEKTEFSPAVRRMLALVGSEVPFESAAAVFLTTILLTAQTKLLPVDESASDPQFSTFYKSFRAAVAQKDAKTLLGVLDPEVQSEIDGDKGFKAFQKHWNPSDPGSKMWTELANVTALGGSFSTEQGTKMFCAPYTYSKFPDAVDSFEHGVILGPNVQLRSGPSDQAAIVGNLSHQIVKVPDWQTLFPGYASSLVREQATSGGRRFEVHPTSAPAFTARGAAGRSDG